MNKRQRKKFDRSNYSRFSPILYIKWKHRGPAEMFRVTTRQISTARSGFGVAIIVDPNIEIKPWKMLKTGAEVMEFLNSPINPAYCDPV